MKRSNSKITRPAGAAAPPPAAPTLALPVSGRRLVDVRAGDVASMREMTQTQLLGLILRLVQMTFRFDTCAAFSYDDKTHRLVLSESIGLPTAGGSDPISLEDDPVIQQVVLESKAIVVNTPLSECEPTLLRAFMAVPIVLNNSVVGTLNMSHVSERPYQDEDMQRLSAIASQAAFLVQSARTMAEIELETREILETVPLPIVKVDFAASRCVVNPAAKVFFDLPVEKVEMKVFYHQAGIFLDRDLSPILAEVQKTGKDLGGIEIKGQGEREAILNLTVAAILSREKTIGAVLVFEDLTEILHARETAERSERLAALGQLAAGVAHEVKNPLTSIKGFTQLLKGKKNDPAFLEKYVSLVSGEIDRLDHIVEQLLQLARPKTAKLKKADLRESARRVAELVESQLDKKSVRHEQTYPDVPAEVLIDASQIEQVILNLLLNAVEAAPLRGGLIRTTIEVGPDSVVLAVQDNGRGIKPEYIEKLFHPFFTTRRGGTGLGLAVSHRIVTDHGGKIFVTSVPGMGARFAIELPRPGEQANPR